MRAVALRLALVTLLPQPCQHHNGSHTVLPTDHTQAPGQGLGLAQVPGLAPGQGLRRTLVPSEAGHLWLALEGLGLTNPGSEPWARSDLTGMVDWARSDLTGMFDWAIEEEVVEEVDEEEELSPSSTTSSSSFFSSFSPSSSSSSPSSTPDETLYDINEGIMLMDAGYRDEGHRVMSQSILQTHRALFAQQQVHPSNHPSDPTKLTGLGHEGRQDRLSACGQGLGCCRTIVFYCFEYGNAWWGQWGPSNVQPGGIPHPPPTPPSTPPSPYLTINQYIQCRINQSISVHNYLLSSPPI